MSLKNFLITAALVALSLTCMSYTIYVSASDRQLSSIELSLLVVGLVTFVMAWLRVIQFFLWIYHVVKRKLAE